LLTVGAWSFLESLAAYLNQEEKKFVHFFVDPQLEKYGYPKSKERLAIRQALQRINFNGEQLAHDMDLMTPMIEKAIEYHENH